MKNIFTLLVAVLLMSFANLPYDFISKFKWNDKNWAQVEKDNLLGFIDRDGIEVVPPKYTFIYPFSKKTNGWAMVEKDGLLGFIDRDGIEVVSVD